MRRPYGRAEAIERARGALAQACAGQGSLVLFTGEPGIGKSAIMELVASEAAAHGAKVTWGRCWEAGGAPAYWPWIQMFRALGWDEDVLAGTLPPLGATEARFAAFDRAVRAFEARARETPLVLVLDDLHAADPPSLLLLLLLTHQLRGSPILVLGAQREPEGRHRPEVGALLARLAREAQVLPLQRLPPEAVAQWVRDAGAGESVDWYQLSEGHPLYLENLLSPWLAAGIARDGVLAYPLPERVPIAWLSVDDLGAHVAAALRRPDLAGQTLDIGGPEDLDGKQLAAALGPRVRYVGISPDDFERGLAAQLGPVVARGIAGSYRWGTEHADSGLLAGAGPLRAGLSLTRAADWVAARARLRAA